MDGARSWVPSSVLQKGKEEESGRKGGRKEDKKEGRKEGQVGGRASQPCCMHSFVSVPDPNHPS